MRIRRTIAATLSVLTLTAVAACGRSGAPAASAGGVPKLPTYQVKANVQLDGSPTWVAAKARGKLVIGGKSDQPYLGYEDVSTGTWSGFDIEIAKMIAADLGFSPDQIQWKAVVSANREDAISSHSIDYFVGTYSITADRKKSVSFAGPYYQAGQDLLVRSDNKDITGPESLKGKIVCTVNGSTSDNQIKAYTGDNVFVQKYDTYSQCVDKLLTDEVDAVTTDDTILKGFATMHPGKLKVVNKQFSTEDYGVGLDLGDSVLRGAIDNAIKAHEANGDWKAAYAATLGLSGYPAPAAPALDRY